MAGNLIDKVVFSAPILSMTEPADSSGDPRTYLAAERTFLAWLRTGIALMGFGFVVARFGLFLRELAASQALAKMSDTGFSLPVGVLLILLGIVVMVAAAIRHHRWIQAIERGQFRREFKSTFVFWLTGLLALIGLAVAIYLAVLF
jgi:putative membrane protein